MIFRALMFCALLLSSAVVGASTPVIIGESQEIHSKVLNENRSYQVYLPASYKWAIDRHYPVLYVLDGKSHFVHSAGSIGYLASNGEIPEVIVVALASTVRVRDFTQTDWSEAWVGGGGAENFKRFLSKELIPEIERSYRADGFRILSGHSAGGQFVLYTVTSEPDLFQAYFAFSPSLDWDHNLPQKSLEKSFDARKSLPAFLYIARSDDSGQALADYEKLVETLKNKSPAGLRWKCMAYPEETHINISLLAQIDALRSLYSGYRFHNDKFVEGLPYAEKHYQDLSKMLGRTMPVPENVLNDFGYRALSDGKIQDAIVLFERNVATNPNSANAYDSLADAYVAAKQWQKAVDASNKALAMAIKFDNPNTAYFKQQAEKMSVQLRQGVGAVK